MLRRSHDYKSTMSLNDILAPHVELPRTTSKRLALLEDTWQLQKRPADWQYFPEKLHPDAPDWTKDLDLGGHQMDMKNHSKANEVWQEP